jgi:c-di-GMP-binding flagellar brake protein YcgR
MALTMSDLATRLGTTTTGQLLVRSGIEIERILDAMIRESSPMQARLPEHMFISRLLHFNAAEQQVLVAYTDHKPANAAVLSAKSVTFMANHHGAQFAFACTKPRQGMHNGRPAILMTAPSIVLAMQPNRKPGGKVPGEADVRCDLWMGVISFEARLVDMSLDGKAFLLSDPAIPLCAGTKLKDARIRDGEREVLTADIDVDQVNQTLLPNGKHATRIGCRIVADREKMEKVIRLFILEPQ